MDIFFEAILLFMMKCFPLILISLLSISALADDGNRTNMLEDDENATAIKELVINASSNLETYRFSIEEVQDMVVVNTTDGIRIYEGQSQILGAGAFNLTGRALKIVMATLVVPAGQEENSSSVSTESYILNNTTYIMTRCNWTAINLPLTEDIWRNQSRLEQSAKMMNASDVRLLGTEEIGGKELYKVEVVPHRGAFSELIREQIGSSLPSAYANISSMFNNTNIRYLLWITEDSHIPEREHITMNMTLYPKDLGLQAPSDRMIIINNSVTAKYSDFNETVIIRLPEGAKSARVEPLIDL